MSTLLGIAAFAGLLVVSAWFTLRWTSRPFDCPDCGGQAEPVADRRVSTVPFVVETRFWCPRCAAVVGHRILGPVWE